MVELCGDDVNSNPLHLLKPLSQLDVRVFYVKISNCELGESTPDHLTVNHISLGVGTVHGKQTSFLRRDRADSRSEEATFINTDPVRIADRGSFEVFNGDEMLISGVLEFGKQSGRWGMKCCPVVPVGNKGFPMGCLSFGAVAPVIEVYVAGCCSGGVVVMMKVVPFGLAWKENKKMVLDSIPAYEKPEFRRRALDKGALSWFKAGVRIGVGISLGVCLGIGVGVGILVRTYNATT